LKSAVEMYSSYPYSRDTLNISSLPSSVADKFINSQPGTIVGPVASNEGVALYKLDNIVSGSNEFVKASHILINQFGDDAKNAEEATKIYNQLQGGADFAALARQYSKDPGSAAHGGDLGWFVPGQMVAPFSAAVEKLEKGKYTKTPVQTQFGWHVILREDSRKQTPPPLEAVKEQLMPYLQRKKVQTMVETLRKQAKVEILVPLTDDQPKTEAAPTEQPVAEEVIVEEVKDKDGKIVGEEVIVDEVVEEKAPATDKAKEAVKPETKK